MTNEEKYTELLKELAELLKSKNDKIAFQGIIIDDLKAKLENAENEIKTLKGSKEK
jgi:hypothetical protein